LGRRGAILILAAFFMIAMLALLALTIDLGYVITAKSELQRATDAAALAGAGKLVDGTDVAQDAAFEYFARNPVGTGAVVDENWLSHLAEMRTQYQADNGFEIKVGHWSPNATTPRDQWFVESSDLPSTMKITASRKNLPLFFARAFGKDSFDLTAEAIARYQPRDIALVLDFSGSMSYDSQLRRIGQFGETARAKVENSLSQCWQDLGSPVYGKLTFAPQYVTLSKAWSYSTKSGTVTVTFRSNDVQVSCSGTISYNKLKLIFVDDSYQTLSVSGTSGTYSGSGGKTIDSVQVYNGSYSTTLTEDAAAIKSFFGLTDASYPYASGNWNDWINYVKTSSNVKGAGYANKYGYMTLMNWWLEVKRSHVDNPNLWKVRAQPVATVKDACGTFFDFIQEVESDDRVAFVMYDSLDETALIENQLTNNFDTVEETIQHRQAGHYKAQTNIAAGIEYGIKELDERGRLGAFKMIVLMTDGQANRPSSETYARQCVIQQAQVAADKHYPILAICLGDDADSDLLKTVAEMTKGRSFVVSGNQTVTDFGPVLLEVFRKIADARPLQIVQ
jgi:Mg-chelatase subunit ChlD